MMAGAEIERQRSETAAATPRARLEAEADTTEIREKLQAMITKVQFFLSRKTICTNAEAGGIASR